MPITRDLSDLPSGGQSRGERWKPSTDPLFAPVVADALVASARPREVKERHYIRPSDALSCARKLSYVALGYEGDEMDALGVFNVTLGTHIHEWLGTHLAEHFGELLEVEYHFDNATVEVDGETIAITCYLDLWFKGDEERPSVVADMKSSGGFSYKMKLGVQGDESGPDLAHLIQAGIGAKLTGAEYVAVLYIAKESISANVAARKGVSHLERFLAEFVVPYAEIADQVDAELLRMWKINRLAHEGFLARRLIPGVAGEIQDPMTGRWEKYESSEDGAEDIIVAAGNYWGCAYCPFQARCAEDGPGRLGIGERD